MPAHWCADPVLRPSLLLVWDGSGQLLALPISDGFGRNPCSPAQNFVEDLLSRTESSMMSLDSRLRLRGKRSSSSSQAGFMFMSGKS